MRYGANGRLFAMPKFRSMHRRAPQMATHLLAHADDWVTRAGRFLRRTSLDELPQLWSVLVGEMSLVGPRPALFNQTDLMEMRRAAGVASLRPGITGWAQINGRDEISMEEKVALDKEYWSRASLLFDLKIILLTIIRGNQGIAH